MLKGEWKKEEYYKFLLQYFSDDILSPYLYLHFNKVSLLKEGSQYILKYLSHMERLRSDREIIFYSSASPLGNAVHLFHAISSLFYPHLSLQHLPIAFYLMKNSNTFYDVYSICHTAYCIYQDLKKTHVIDEVDSIYGYKDTPAEDIALALAFLIYEYYKKDMFILRNEKRKYPGISNILVLGTNLFQREKITRYLYSLGDPEKIIFYLVDVLEEYYKMEIEKEKYDLLIIDGKYNDIKILRKSGFRIDKALFMIDRYGIKREFFEKNDIKCYVLADIKDILESYSSSFLKI